MKLTKANFKQIIKEVISEFAVPPASLPVMGDDAANAKMSYKRDDEDELEENEEEQEVTK